MEKTFVEILKETRESIDKTEDLIRFEYCGTQAGCHCAVGHVFANSGIDMKAFEDEEFNGRPIYEVIDYSSFKQFTEHLEFLEGIQSTNDDRSLSLEERKQEIISQIDAYIKILEDK